LIAKYYHTIKTSEDTGTVQIVVKST
jgi:hypothetical protein